MTGRTTIALLIAACALAGAIWLMETRMDSTEAARFKSARLLDVESDDIVYLEIEKGDMRISCARKEGSWFIETPVRARADLRNVDSILSALQILPSSEVVSSEERRRRGLDMADYGLVQPRARFVLRDRIGRREILIGDDAPLGTAVYVRLVGADEVIATSRSILGIIPPGVESLRDRALMQRDQAKATTLEIETPTGGFLRVARIRGKWLIRQPIQAMADQDKIMRLLNAVYDLRVQRFIWDPALSAAGETMPQPSPPAATPQAILDAYRLSPDEASARVRVWLDGVGVGEELIIGKETPEDGETVYAKIRDKDSIYAISKDILNRLSFSVSDIRSGRLVFLEPAEISGLSFEARDRKLVFQGGPEAWRIVEPASWPADAEMLASLVHALAGLQAEEFINTAGLDLKQYSLDPPSYSVTLISPPPAGTRPGASPESVQEIRLAMDVGLDAKSDNVHFVKLRGDTSVARVSSEALRTMATGLANPLLYRDRIIMALPSAGIRRIHLERNGEEQAVARAEDGEWTIAPRTDMHAMVVDREQIAKVLKAVSNLQVVRFESRAAGNEEKYGLISPTAVLTLGLSGQDGIQKSILMGGPAGNEAHYAAIRGEDVVFVLSADFVSALTSDLLSARSAPATVNGAIQ